MHALYQNYFGNGMLRITVTPQENPAIAMTMAKLMTVVATRKVHAKTL